MKTSAIGLLGGTFDPIHLGHIQLAMSVYDALNLQEVRLIPCSQPLLREGPSADPQQRFRMVQLAITDYPGLIADDRELKRGGYSYTIDTLASLRAEDATVPLCLIVGIDQFSHFDQWRQWRQIPELAHIIVTTRADYVFTPGPGIEEFLRQHQIHDSDLLYGQPGGAIFFQKVTPFAVSGSEIRSALHQGLDISAKLPHAVWEYICDNKLYCHSFL